MSCNLVRHFHVLQFHALLLGPSFSCPAISCPSFSALILIVLSRYKHDTITDGDVALNWNRGMQGVAVLTAPLAYCGYASCWRTCYYFGYSGWRANLNCLSVNWYSKLCVAVRWYEAISLDRPISLERECFVTFTQLCSQWQWNCLKVMALLLDVLGLYMLMT